LVRSAPSIWEAVVQRLCERVVVVVALAALACAGSASANAGSGPLVAPAKLGTYVPLAKVHLMQSALGKKHARADALETAQSTVLLSRSHGGRPALVATYASNNADFIFTLLAVRAGTPQPWEQYSVASDLDLARPPRVARAVGDAWCEILNDPTPVGKTPSADSVHVLSCRRSDANLTVAVFLAGPSEDPAAFVALVDEAWKDFHGSTTGTVAHLGTRSHATLPAKLAGLVDPALATAGLKPSDAAFQRKLSAWGKQTYAEVSRAFGGAPAVTRAYRAAAKGDDSWVRIAAVEAPAPAPFQLAQNPARLGLVRPTEEVITVGDSRCDIQNTPTIAGDTPAPDSVTVLRCQRTSGSHTVIATAAGKISHSPQKVAAFADQAWDALGWK
jgi:hypothetical protein